MASISALVLALVQSATASSPATASNVPHDAVLQQELNRFGVKTALVDCNDLVK